MTAMLSKDRVYRYSLTRDVAPLTGDGTVAFIGLNPSTADEEQDDPTIRRCIDFARRWGFARLKMLNLYAYRATDPLRLADPDDPVGPENDCTIAKVVGGSDLVVCAWGIRGARERVDRVLALVAAPHCLGHTADGYPRHPLYVPAVTLPVPFAHCPRQAAWREASNQDRDPATNASEPDGRVSEQARDTVSRGPGPGSEAEDEAWEKRSRER